MAALWNTAGHYIFILWLLLSFFFLLSSFFLVRIIALSLRDNFGLIWEGMRSGNVKHQWDAHEKSLHHELQNVNCLRALISLKVLALYKSFTYLLTYLLT